MKTESGSFFLLNIVKGKWKKLNEKFIKPRDDKAENVPVSVWEGCSQSKALRAGRRRAHKRKLKEPIH